MTAVLAAGLEQGWVRQLIAQAAYMIVLTYRQRCCVFDLSRLPSTSELQPVLPYQHTIAHKATVRIVDFDYLVVLIAPITTVTFFTNALGDKHRLNKPQTVEFPFALLTAHHALSLLPNTALLQPDDASSSYNRLELDKPRLSADAAEHLTIVRWHLLGSEPTTEAQKVMLERERLVCGCKSRCICTVAFVPVLPSSVAVASPMCTALASKELPVAVTPSPTLLDLLLDAIEQTREAEPSELEKHIQASCPEISAVHEICFAYAFPTSPLLQARHRHLMTQWQ